ncbi:phosphotransferase [Microtetraspora glauca]|uniref:Phosphotransferase n=1 Tax=Microtetraspora glauca TaxID=1996 RepID=A0ABV3GU57_MICGL
MANPMVHIVDVKITRFKNRRSDTISGMALRTVAEPPASVLAAFQLAGVIRPLPGGQGQSFRVGDAVVKPADNREEAEWSARLFAGLQAAEFRVPRPCRSRDGAYVVDGWTASEFLAGQAGPAGRWASLLAVSKAFHRELRDVPRPDFLDRRDHPWAIADRIAWSEMSQSLPTNAEAQLSGLLGLRRPVETPEQLIHGDLTGNVLFHPNQSPTVIDFSPYWRPADYADAIVVADGLLYHGAGSELVDTFLTGYQRLQMLVRALIFRLVTLIVWKGPDQEVPEDELTRFARVTHLVKMFERRILTENASAIQETGRP